MTAAASCVVVIAREIRRRALPAMTTGRVNIGRKDIPRTKAM